ncbi:hypothetical protein T8K17_17275 [Thalassobaculum sp. OXR-137]|uniref:hypothetical protein n=1 Tax=Thalassobaculum sp. OXR-137 TaxID=3100173 RepID=UPI002AC9469B|nr:hypothetical protein [Thalassobaculum sp. OXR-137]WPZ32986.1 hypothetical protein T8K17_17275 [Thalassobaculum sp. OXR-137]
MAHAIQARRTLPLGGRPALAVTLVALLLVLAGCAGRQVAPPEIAFGPGDPRALVLVGISAGQRDGTLTFTRLADGSDRLLTSSDRELPIRFKVSNDDAATVLLVAPGRYLISEAAIVTARGEEYRPSYRSGFGYHDYRRSPHPYWFHHGWNGGWRTERVTVTEGERFQVKNGPRGVENQAWIITVPAGQVTALGHFAFDWTRSSNLLNVEQTPYKPEIVDRALAAYGGVTAPVVEAQWSLYGPNLPPPPMMHWSRDY